MVNEGLKTMRRNQIQKKGRKLQVLLLLLIGLNWNIYQKKIRTRLKKTCY